MSKHFFNAGDKVFHKGEGRLATVLDIYGDGVNGAQGEIWLDLSGNTLITDIEPYSADLHSAYDHTFIPIKQEWKDDYGITADIPVRAHDGMQAPGAKDDGNVPPVGLF